MEPSATFANAFALPPPDHVRPVAVAVGAAVGIAWLAWLLWPGRPGDGLDLFRSRAVRRLFSSGAWPLAPQLVVAAALAAVLWWTLTGPLSPGRNPGSALVWGIWWPTLTVVPLLLGRAFCGVCPLGLLHRPSAWPASLRVPLPAASRRLGVVPAAVLLLGLALLDRTAGVEASAWATGLFLAAMVAVAWVANQAADRFWCRQACPVGALQAAIARIGAARLESRSAAPAAPCSLGLPPGTGGAACGLCGDCSKGREDGFALRLGGTPTPDAACASAPGEGALLAVLAGMALFGALVASDPWAVGSLLYERSIFPGAPALPAWVPVVPLPILIGVLLAACAAVAAGIGPLLRLLLRAPRDYGVPGLVPVAAAAWLALELPALSGLGDLAARVGSVAAGGAWSDVPLPQAASWSFATWTAVRLVVLACGLVAGLALSWRAAGRPRPGIGIGFRRALADGLWLAALSAAPASAFLLPWSMGDRC